MIKTSDKSNEIKPIHYLCNGKTLTFSSPRIMAIVNITPDSFYDGGKFGNSHDVLKDVEDKVSQGAHIIDIGAASSRPGAEILDIETEWQRLVVVLPEIRKNFPDIFISIDTYRAEIAKRSVALGIDIVNDVSGGTMDEGMLAAVCELDVPYVLMHMDGNPQNMQNNAPYVDVVKSVQEKFKEQIQQFTVRGFHKIILDPGFGFGKSLQNNYELLKALGQFKTLGYPVLAGVSRKSMINKVIHSNPVTALNGTTVLNTIALLNGASILRVHDVTEAKQAVELVSYYQNA